MVAAHRAAGSPRAERGAGPGRWRRHWLAAALAGTVDTALVLLHDAGPVYTTPVLGADMPQSVA